MLSTRSRFKVLNEIAEEEKAASFSVEDVEAERIQAENKRERRRNKITIELFETEKTYLQHLHLVNKFFDFPLRFNCLISEKVHGQIFSNIEQIMAVNKTLLEYMEQTTPGEAFHYLGPFLKLYSSYANNHQNAINILQEWMQKSVEFSQFIQSQEENPEVNGLKLNALLITPVQRIPRYKLLLEDLVENTSPDHHDYNQLKEATKEVSDIAMHINDHIKQHENFQKMLSIQKSFDSSAPKILAPGRTFIKEGSLKKVSRRGGKSLERMFFLFSDMLIYGKPKFLDSGGHSYSCCCVLPLKHCEVERVFGNMKKTAAEAGGMFKHKPWCEGGRLWKEVNHVSEYVSVNNISSLTLFSCRKYIPVAYLLHYFMLDTQTWYQISCKEENLLLYSHDQEEVKSWINELETNIKRLSSNRSTLRKPSSHKAPMRGKSLFKHRQKEKKKDNKQKEIMMQTIKEKSPTESESSRGKHRISPLRHLSAFSDLDIRECMSPNKQARVDTKATSTPVNSSQTRSGRSFRPTSWNTSEIATCQETDASSMSDDEVFTTNGEQEEVTVENTGCHTENTFMQVTMDDLGEADVVLDSFCRPPLITSMSENICTERREVYCPRTAHNQSLEVEQHCSGPFQRIITGSQKLKKRCSEAMSAANSRIQETKSNCSIQ